MVKCRVDFIISDSLEFSGRGKIRRNSELFILSTQAGKHTKMSLIACKGQLSLKASRNKNRMNVCHFL